MLLRAIIFIPLLWAFSTDRENFEELTFHGMHCFIAKNILCKEAPSFRRMIALNHISGTDSLERQSDTFDIQSAEMILQRDLDNYLIDNIEKTDTTTVIYRRQVNECKGSYDDIKGFTRQVKSFVSNNKRYIYMNIYCVDIPIIKDLQKTNWIKVNDGGECFWQIIIDLSDEKIVAAKHNGFA